MKREVERSSYDSHFVAEVLLSTGKLLTFDSASKPANWDLSDLQRGVISEARRKLSDLNRLYDITHGPIRVYRVDVHTQMIREVHESRRFDSEVLK